jgi:hypothetical protein
MIIQQINRDDPDKVWVTVINRQGATLTTHWPVSKFVATGNLASVTTAEVALPARAGLVTSTVGNFVGLMDEDLANDNTGLAQVYGYHASVLGANMNTAAITVRPGTGMAPLNVVGTVGMNSVGADLFGPVIALGTLAAFLSGHPAYGDHVFIRAL